MGELSIFNAAGISSPFAVTWFIFANGGWVVFIIVFFWGFWQAYLQYIRQKYDNKIEYVILAIDVPKETEQTPKAVESVFSHIHGLQIKGDLKKRYLQGYTQPVVSFELISLGGYIQFLVRTPRDFRDLIEAAFYAQYPDAEITEVGDYVTPYQVIFPNDQYDIYGTELKLNKRDFYPIKTYPSFEHTMTQQLIDPMASTLEIMSRLRPGEQFWIQILISPPNDDRWRDRAFKTIRKLVHSTIGDKKKSFLDNVTWLPTNVITGLVESFTADLVSPGGEEKREERTWPTLMQHLTPAEKAVVEAIGIKVSKLFYHTKIRIIYLGEKGVFDKSRVPAIMGAIKQFNTMDLNGFRPNPKTKTTVVYFRKAAREAWRKKKIMWGYRARSMRRGRSPFMLNVEELASLYHFPVITVKAPLVQKTEMRKGEPPSRLPVAGPQPLQNVRRI